MSKRLKKWKIKTEPEYVARQYALSRPIQLGLGLKAQAQHQALFNKLKPLVEKHITNPYMVSMYLSAGQQLWSIWNEWKGKARDMMACAEILKWWSRGLDKDLLLKIAGEIGFNISALEKRTEEYMALRRVEADIISEDINTLLKLFGETGQIERDPSGNITKITISSRDADGNPITITYEFTYDAEGNLKSWKKQVG